MKKLIVVLFLTFQFAPILEAQCPACKSALVSNNSQKNPIEKKFGRGINSGILYLLAMPYIAVGAVGYFWWKKQKTNAEKKG